VHTMHNSLGKMGDAENHKPLFACGCVGWGAWAGSSLPACRLLADELAHHRMTFSHRQGEGKDAWPALLIPKRPA